ncbi:MAG: hypothetical protein AVDCRST_MAG37-2531 [uncultured Rubrobacteraceae bacterium]|uniref:Uncharacterized protein n=1 Tax=uncultured Rubrobacteraceae bacterium TaxID=349277 RepID=A0A6J4QSW2_9ACTN|nr:MAG: hypothetical protein AVDCRST_MAG37-2531 [uncultured Rubrobacteraceae bacterium]
MASFASAERSRERRADILFGNDLPERRVKVLGGFEGCPARVSAFASRTPSFRRCGPRLGRSDRQQGENRAFRESLELRIGYALRVFDRPHFVDLAAVSIPTVWRRDERSSG